MLIKHSLLYLSARIVPGLLSLVALALYTRLLSADQYGHYALAIAAMGIVNASCLQWLSNSFARFFPSHAQQPQDLLSTTLGGFLLVIAFTGVAGALLAGLWPDETKRWFIALVVIIAWAQAWFDLNLRIANVCLAPIRYGLLLSFKSLLALAAALVLFKLGLGVVGVLLGLLLGLVAAPLILTKYWKSATLRRFDVGLFRKMFDYGGPMVVTVMLTSMLDVSDRFLIGWLMDVKAAGTYAAAYDLTQQSQGTLIGVVYLAGFPLAVRALEEEGLKAAGDQLQQNLFVLLSVALPACMGMIVLADNIAYSFLGADFRAEAAQLIPYIAIAVFIGGLKSFYLDYAFQLTRQTGLLVWPVAMAAILNIILNCLWIPQYGLLGAVFATLAAFVVNMAMTWYLGQRVFTYPRYHHESYKLVVAALGMAGGLLVLQVWRGMSALLVQVSLGAAINLFILVALDTRGSRTRLHSWLLQYVTK